MYISVAEEIYIALAASLTPDASLGCGSVGAVLAAQW
jgi:hypothetical protein